MEDVKNAGAVTEEFRELVRVVTIDQILTHTNADSLELAVIGGWQCCVQKGEFRAGDTALYCEIDSMLPTSNPAFTFLEARKESLRMVGDQVYARIKTIRLRKELSQGLVIPIPADMVGKVQVGDNLTQSMGVLKYEAKPVAEVEAERPKTLLERFCNWVAGGVAPKLQLPWPAFLVKSEEQRVQNISAAYANAAAAEELFEASYKLDGTSITAWVRKNDADTYDRGVASRNNELSMVDIHWGLIEQFRRWFAHLLLANRRMFRIGRVIIPTWKRGVLASEDLYVKYVLENGLFERLEEFAKRNDCDVAIQGELCGPGIGGNFEQLDEKQLFVYKVYVAKGGMFEALLPGHGAEAIADLRLVRIPVFDMACTLPRTMRDCLLLAEGPKPPEFKKVGYREGLVFKSHGRDFSFKVISNHYLLKSGD